MNKLLLFLTLLLSSTIVYGQGTETFDNVPTNNASSYDSRTWTGDDGSTWNATNSRTSSADVDGSQAIMMNDDEVDTYVESGTISGGIGDITISTRRNFSGGSGNIDILINGTSVGTVPYSGTAQTTIISGINISGDFVIRINNDIGGSGGGGADRVSIDNVIWTAYSTAPTVGFDSAMSTQNEADASFPVNLPVTLINYASNVDMDVEVTGGTAELGDYALSTVALNFTGNSTLNVSININDDADFDDETVELTITETSATGVTISTAVHTITIIDDEEPPVPTIADVRINEVDSSPAADEFVELFGTPNFSLDGLILVFFNGNSSDESYLAVDLTGESLDANGFLLVGKASAASPSPEIVITASIQDGVDGVGLYYDDISNFSTGTVATTTNLVDALVYASNTSDDSDLRTKLGFTAANGHVDSPINESENGARATESVQRGSWFVAVRTPRAVNALPIELASFNAKENGKVVNLNWQTTQEINNDHFQIQHSTNGRNFQQIGKVAGAGNSEYLIDYEFTHSTPVAGANYYRLQQFDYDGASSFSDVVVVNMDKGNQVAIYPNPVANELTIALAEETQTKAIAEIINQTGSVIVRTELAAKTLNQTMNTANLPSGIYFLRIINGNEITTTRFIKK